MKKCRNCKEEKVITEFYNDKYAVDGKEGRCKMCCDLKTLKWRKNSRAHYNKTARIWRKNNPSSNRGYHLKKKFNLSINQYDHMFSQQKGCCHLCGKHQNDCKRRLAVDHDHKTGKIRSLLCSNCNKGLGNFGERVEVLVKAVQYLSMN